MKNIKLTKKGKKFFGGILAVTVTGMIGLGNLNNNHDEVVYIDEFDTVYADDVKAPSVSNQDFEKHNKDLHPLDAVNVSENPALDYEVTHVYEDGCIDVMEPIDGESKFYCEAEFK